MPKRPAPDGWQWAALTSIARMESGHTPSRKHPEYWGGGIPWISIGDAKLNHGRTIETTLETTNELGIANSSSRVLPKGTVCLSRTASVGYVVVMGRDMATSQDFVNWVCSPELEPRFLQYVLLAEGEDILRFASGSVHQTIYFPEAKAFHVCYPPLPEQQRIVGILDEAFAGIATAKANAEKNLRNARALFTSDLQSVLKASGSRWITKTLGDACEMYQPKTIGMKDLVPDGAYLVYGANGVIGRYNAFNHADAELLITCRGATCGTVNVSTPKSWITGNAMVVRPIGGAIDLQFLEFVFRGGIDLSAAITGAAQPQITRANLSPLVVRYPSDVAEQRRLAGRFALLKQETTDLAKLFQRKLAALDALKKSLLHQAFSGQLRQQSLINA